MRCIPYVRQTKDGFYFDGGDVKWINKNKLTSHDIIEQPRETTMLRFKVSQKVALAAGLPVGEMQEALPWPSLQQPTTSLTPATGTLC